MQQFALNLLVNLVTIVISSVGFTLSVMAHCLAGMLPFVNVSKAQVIHTSSLTVVAASLPSSEESSAKPVVSLQVGGAQVNFRTSMVTALQQQRKARRASLPPQPASPTSIDYVESSVDQSSPSLPANEPVTSATEPASETTSSAEDEKDSSSRRSSLTQRIVPQVFRRRTTNNVQSVAGPSNPKQRPSTSPSTSGRNVSISPRLRGLSFRREPESPADAHGRIPYVPNPSAGETFQTGFVNPFKGKGKSPSPSPASTPHKTTFALPEVPPSKSPRRPPLTSMPTPSSQHKRHRSLASYITSAIRPSRPSPQRLASEPNSRSSSPRRRSFGLSIGISPYSSSSSASSSSRSRRSFSFSSLSSSAEGDRSRDAMPRTQPYGYPYFAPMPVPSSPTLSRPGMQRAGSSGSGSGRRHAMTPPVMEVKPIFEDEGGEGGLDDGLGGLGLEFGEIRVAEGW
ncbi:hypothetical protein BC629DRAFT_518470 [Irpex lacteus]|nr:hypothetical protein BC629DRAFT_518470 [Irpex lacteus]